MPRLHAALDNWKPWQDRQCKVCGVPLPDDRRRDNHFCSAACRQYFHRHPGAMPRARVVANRQQRFAARTAQLTARRAAIAKLARSLQNTRSRQT